MTAKIIAGFGDQLPVSAMPMDGTFPTGTAQWEKRNIALEIPVWDIPVCIQCNKCAIVCPHATIRIKVYDPKYMKDAPPTFKAMDYKGTEYKGMKYTVQVAPEDCTGCGLCVDVCPAKNKTETRLKAINMMPQPPIREPERVNYDFFLALPEVDRRTVKVDTVKGSQFLQPLFEYSGACSGCGETPYVKLVTQLFGDRMRRGQCDGLFVDLRRQPADDALDEEQRRTRPGVVEFAVRRQRRIRSGDAADHRQAHGDGAGARAGPRGNDRRDRSPQGSSRQIRSDEAGIYEQRQRVEELKKKLACVDALPEAKSLLSLADNLVKKSVWIIGGDGWAYDIGFGGLDHVLASGRNVNILVLDTEVYSNTGGQMSKSTPRSAVAKFAAGGKPLREEGPRA